MRDVTVTLTDEERVALVNGIVLLRVHDMSDAPAESALEKLRAAQPAAPSPLDRLEAWLARANRRDAWFVFTSRFEVRMIDELSNPTSAEAPSLAAAIDAALDQVEVN